MKLKHEIQLSNLDKIFWPKEGYTKGDVIEFYEHIANIILPYLKDRPMVLNRHPNGIEGESFFQKQIDSHTPSFVERVVVEHSHKDVTYLMVQNIETLLYVANLGCIELNPFHAQVPKLDHPTYMVIDLDPEAVSFAGVCELALSIHELLESVNIKNYVKTSGGKGLHIYVPLKAKYDFAQSQELAHLIGTIMESRHPKLVSLTRLPKNRQKRVYVDFLRNSVHQTVASVYSIRPKPGATVSTPLLWEELKAGITPLDFTIKTLPARLKAKGDLFKAVLGQGINLKKSLELLANKI